MTNKAKGPWTRTKRLCAGFYEIQSPIGSFFLRDTNDGANAGGTLNWELDAPDGTRQAFALKSQAQSAALARVRHEVQS